MGSGGVGGYFGAKLQRAGERVTLVARGAHLEALKRSGLAVRSATEGDTVVRPAAVERLEGVDRADAVLFCVKSFDTDDAAARLWSILGPDTAVLSLHTGVDLANDAVEQIVKFAETIPPGNRASIAHDLLQGRRLELEALHGHAARLGERLGVPTPALFAVYAALAPHAAGRRG